MIMVVGGLATLGYLPGEWGAEPRDCADHKCQTVVKKGDACFIEMQSSDVYCDACGKVKRYIAKKAKERAARNAINCTDGVDHDPRI